MFTQLVGRFNINSRSGSKAGAPNEFACLFCGGTESAEESGALVQNNYRHSAECQSSSALFLNAHAFGNAVCQSNSLVGENSDIRIQFT